MRKGEEGERRKRDEVGDRRKVEDGPLLLIHVHFTKLGEKIIGAMPKAA